MVEKKVAALFSLGLHGLRWKERFNSSIPEKSWPWPWPYLVQSPEEDGTAAVGSMSLQLGRDEVVVGEAEEAMGRRSAGG